MILETNDMSEQLFELVLPPLKSASQTTVGTPDGLRLVGRGRSGAVYLDHDDLGRSVARKVFQGEGLSRIVLYLMTGAPNPYSWNEQAVQSAVCRRQILQLLVRYWFGTKLRLPKTHGMVWNEHFQAYELRARFVAGRHAPLRWFAADDSEDPVQDLTQEIMRPLQTHLLAAGLDGLVWQAGFGNPVAASNFMLTQTRDRKHSWTWIDLESGVPALFPLNPWPLFRFYLPRSIAYGHCLFDDVNVPKLRAYLETQCQQIEKKLGSGTAAILDKLVDKLESHQTEWKSLNRTERGTAYQQTVGRISEQESQWYRKHPLRWQTWLMRNGVESAGARLLSAGQKVAGWCCSPKPARLAWKLAGFVGSSKYRQILAKRYVLWRIRTWKDRQFLRANDARGLRAELRRDDAGLCVTDFGVHIAIKPLAKFLQWCVVPLFFLAGAIDATTMALLIASGGAIGRTVYTAFRCLRSALQGGRKPWLALAVGALPFVGNVAFPLQLAFWSTNPKHRLPQFLLYDCCAGFGRNIPIWGGCDSLLECWANRVPDLFLRRSKTTRTSTTLRRSS